MLRIRAVEEPILRKRGFEPTDSSFTVWRGRYRGYRAQILFPPEYPAAPLTWYWIDVPRGFHHLVQKRMCIEALLLAEFWAPDITMGTIFEALDSISFGSDSYGE